MSDTDPARVPEVCTLPTAEQPLRLAEFDALFAAALRGITTTGPTRARLELAGPAGLAGTARDLTARESSCCSFFTFTVRTVPATDEETVTLEIEVPHEYADVLAALVRRAASAADR
ncbi:hypothetical protein Ait01nite_015100 [Actinoplanes italicus]|uniref:Uncharacterized protein n=1 Tax=Actinoplanes italicus TaxID=113567 RepID=A0A2T0KHM3_9ACTN|nr:hypothetical protein [Actinoplanes italicus]PRX22943.1 hypothetical protein CLV67_104471 [Actinoplanes italicus]GIE28465.1 hypothetical protein Ait01nite_015100 [Actinoplanes italicus]